MKTEKEITISYLNLLQRDMAVAIVKSNLDRRNQPIVNLKHDYSILERAIEIIEESGVEE